MSLYSERLATLKKDFKLMKDRKGKKPFTKHQQLVYNLVQGISKVAKLDIGNITIELKRGDENKGLEHILLRHFCSGCPGEIEAKDILNIADIIKRGIRLNKIGVSNSDLIVYQQFKGANRHKLVLKPIENGNFVITLYNAS